MFQSFNSKTPSHHEVTIEIIRISKFYSVNSASLWSFLPILLLALGSHRYSDCFESIPFHETNQTLVNSFDHRRALINKTGIDLYSAGAGSNFFVGIGSRKDSTNADNR